MATLKEEAQAYEPKQTLNIADLDKVSVDIQTEDDEYEFDDVDGEGKPIKKRIKQKVVKIEGKTYRIPNSVLNQLKVLLEDNPELKFFKVKKTGQGLATDYTVIPIIKVD